MWAIAEYENKSLAIIPQLWLFEENTKCYWPSVKTEEDFENLVKDLSVPQQVGLWSIHKVRRVLYTSDIYERMREKLQQLLDECSSESAGSTSLCFKRYNLKNKNKMEKTTSTTSASRTSIRPNHLNLNKPELTRKYSMSQKPFNAKGKKRTMESPNDNSSKTLHISYSDDDWDNQDYQKQQEQDPLQNIGNDEEDMFSRKSSSASSPESSLLENNENNQSSQLQFQPTTSGSQSVFANKVLPQVGEKSFESLMTIMLTGIKEVQRQHSIILNELLRAAKIQNLHNLTQPSDWPNLPVASKSDYKSVENFLEDQNNYLYMRKRLSAIGGENVRTSTMAMLRFLMTDKIATKFNWAGRDKYPFKGRNMMKVIYEAIKVSFDGDRASKYEVNDKFIAQAVKDWLKLSKQRYLNKSKRNE